jgi:hypothetical protein
MNIDTEILKSWLSEWMNTLCSDPGNKEEWWDTQRGLCSPGAYDFVKWIIANKLANAKAVLNE